MKGFKTVNVFGTECTISISKYENGNTAIQLMDAEDGFPYAVASVNFDEKLPSVEVYIKDYSENQGIADILMKEKIISEPIGSRPTGHVVVNKHTLLI